MGSNNTLADKVAGDVLMKGVRDMLLDERQLLPNKFDPSQAATIRLQARRKHLEKIQNDASAKEVVSARITSIPVAKQLKDQTDFLAVVVFLITISDYVIRKKHGVPRSKRRLSDNS